MGNNQLPPNCETMVPTGSGVSSTQIVGAAVLGPSNVGKDSRVYVRSSFTPRLVEQYPRSICKLFFMDLVYVKWGPTWGQAQIPKTMPLP